jgi:low affinity Fe/Cu permease
VTVVGLDLLWVVFSARFEFPTRLESVFQTMVAAVTLAMVFVIQHTQAREQAATQRKLDEILRSLPAADKSMITLETAPDRELRAAARAHRDQGCLQPTCGELINDLQAVFVVPLLSDLDEAVLRCQLVGGQVVGADADPDRTNLRLVGGTLQQGC